MEMTLHAVQDDWNLNANGDERGDEVIFQYPNYLTDPQGNKLTDPQGNYLVGYTFELLTPIIMHSIPDDWNLNAE